MFFCNKQRKNEDKIEEGRETRRLFSFLRYLFTEDKWSAFFALFGVLQVSYGINYSKN